MKGYGRKERPGQNDVSRVEEHRVHNKSIDEDVCSTQWMKDEWLAQGRNSHQRRFTTSALMTRSGVTYYVEDAELHTIPMDCYHVWKLLSVKMPTIFSHVPDST